LQRDQKREFWARFDSELNIGKGKGKRKTIAARHKGEYDSETVFLIPKKGTTTPERNRSYFVISNEYHFYCDGKAVFPVEIVTPKTISGIEIFENIPVSKTVLNSPNNGGIARIIIRPPNIYYPDTYFVLIKLADDDWTELFQIFYENNYEDFETMLRDGTIEIIIKRNVDNFSNIKEKILAPFKQCDLPPKSEA
jgi:hypothetical protein